MTTYQYRVDPAPVKPAKGKGDVEARFAAMLAEALNAAAAEGWDFLRAETLPSEERQGLTGTRTVFRTVLVFRRPAEPGEDDATREAMKLLEHKDGPATAPLTAEK